MAYLMLTGFICPVHYSVGHVHERSIFQDAGVVDHDIDAAGFCSELVYKALVVEVPGMRDDGPTALPCQRLELRPAPPGGDDLRAGMRERKRRCPTDAGTRAGDQR
jgi:hypothetical protein